MAVPSILKKNTPCPYPSPLPRPCPPATKATSPCGCWSVSQLSLPPLTLLQRQSSHYPNMFSVHCLLHFVNQVSSLFLAIKGLLSRPLMSSHGWIQWSILAFINDMSEHDPLLSFQLLRTPFSRQSGASLAKAKSPLLAIILIFPNRWTLSMRAQFLNIFSSICL